MRITRSIGCTKIFPSPTSPVRAAERMACTHGSTYGSEHTISILTFSWNSMTIAVPRYCSNRSCSPPCPLTRLSVMPVIPARNSAVLTSGTRSGRTMVVISFTLGSSRLQVGHRFDRGGRGDRRWWRRRHFLEPPAIRFPRVEDGAGAGTPGLVEVLLNELAQHPFVHRVQAADSNHLQVAVGFEQAALIEDVGDAVRHPGRKVPPDRSQHDHHAAGHVLAAVVARAFDHCDGTGVPDREAVARAAGRKQPSGRRAVQGGVPDQHPGRIRGAAEWPDHDFAAGQTLADVVVRFAFELQMHAR